MSRAGKALIINLGHELQEEVWRVHQETGVSLSEFVRRAVKAYLKASPDEPTKLDGEHYLHPWTTA